MTRSKPHLAMAGVVHAQHVEDPKRPACRGSRRGREWKPSYQPVNCPLCGAVTPPPGLAYTSIGMVRK